MEGFGQVDAIIFDVHYQKGVNARRNPLRALDFCPLTDKAFSRLAPNFCRVPRRMQKHFDRRTPAVENEKRIRLGVCTPDGNVRQRLLRLSELWGQEMCIELDVYQAQDGLLGDADLLFFEAGEREADVEHWAAERRGAGHFPALIALVENSRQAIASYRCHPTALLQRETGYAGLAAALDRCFPVWSRGMVWLDLPYQRERVRMPLCQVQYVEAQGRNTRLQCTGGAVEVNKPLGQLAEMLPQPPFLRCQKSFLVRLSAVAQMQNGMLIMSNGQEIPVSRKQMQEVREKVGLWNSRF